MSMNKRKKSRKKLIILLVISVVLIGIISMQLFVYKEYNLFFSQRYSSQKNKEIFEFKDFENLKKQGVHFSTDKKQRLKGYFYSSVEETQTYKAVIVFSHAFGNGGHNNYLPEINYFAQKGFLCFAFDNLGNDESEGVATGGFPQAPIDLDYALLALKDIEMADGLDVMLFGEDLGAYSVASVIQKKASIKSAVCISGFNASEDLFVKEKKSEYGNFIGTIMTPFAKVCDMIKFNDKAYFSSLGGFEKTNAQVLVLHSQDDKVVPIEKSFDKYQKKFSDKENISFKKFTDKGHSITRSYEANKYNEKKSKEKESLIKNNKNAISEDDLNNFLKDFDKKLSNQLDEKVMNEIVTFYETNITKKTEK